MAEVVLKNIRKVYPFGERMKKKDIDGKTLLKPTAPAAPEQAEPAEYISSEQAEDAALGHAGVERSASVFERTQWKLSKGTAIYEVEFISAGVEYEYKINALKALSKDIF